MIESIQPRATSCYSLQMSRENVIRNTWSIKSSWHHFDLWTLVQDFWLGWCTRDSLRYFWEEVSSDYHWNPFESETFSHYNSSSQNAKYLPVGFRMNIMKLFFKEPKGHCSKLQVEVICEKPSVQLIGLLCCHLVEMNESGEQEGAHRCAAIFQVKTVSQRLD